VAAGASSFREVVERFVEFDGESVKRLVHEALGLGLQPHDVIAARDEENSGEVQERGEYFLPELAEAGVLLNEVMGAAQRAPLPDPPPPPPPRPPPPPGGHGAPAI